MYAIYERSLHDGRVIGGAIPGGLGNTHQFACTCCRWPDKLAAEPSFYELRRRFPNRHFSIELAPDDRGAQRAEANVT